MADRSKRRYGIWVGMMIMLVMVPMVSAELAPGRPAALPPGSPPSFPTPEGQAPAENALGAPQPPLPGEYSYNPSGRRDPFAVVLKDAKTGEDNQSLPPLQQLSLTELNLIGIVWGGFGYSAMMQAPDGKGYTVRQGTRVGPNGGAVSSITENALVVQERFTDVYGNKQVREYVKLLHAKEGSE
ncbi:MAG TPA: pilus assembly protein PilP [Nitrospiraceae bacterium]|nr:pilus assembly protein PilP [Nitrospiraceae bacterium]